MENKLSCFAKTLLENKSCDNTNCVYFYNCSENKNCVINASNKKTHTLQEIGDIFDISRMRVCQIEKKSLKKIRSLINL